jgi:hypothetical protein
VAKRSKKARRRDDDDDDFGHYVPVFRHISARRFVDNMKQFGLFVVIVSTALFIAWINAQ